MVKIISLSDSIYEKLKALKRERSFSETIDALIEEKPRKKLDDFYGIWSHRHSEVKKMKKMIEEDRRKFMLRGQIRDVLP